LIQSAIISGNLDSIKFLLDNNYARLSAFTFRMAIKSGNLKVVKWLYSQRCPIY